MSMEWSKRWKTWNNQVLCLFAHCRVVSILDASLFPVDLYGKERRLPSRKRKYYRKQEENRTDKHWSQVAEKIHVCLSKVKWLEMQARWLQVFIPKCACSPCLQLCMWRTRLVQNKKIRNHLNGVVCRGINILGCYLFVFGQLILDSGHSAFQI